MREVTKCFYIAVEVRNRVRAAPVCHLNLSVFLRSIAVRECSQRAEQAAMHPDPVRS